MSTAVTNSRDDGAVKPQQEVIPPLFAGALRDELAARIHAALASGDYDAAARLLQSRCEALTVDPPQDWTGVWRLTEK